MTAFATRSQATEWMDTQPVPEADFTACLVDLAQVNRLTLAYRPTLHFLSSFPHPLEGGVGAGGPRTPPDPPSASST